MNTPNTRCAHAIYACPRALRSLCAFLLLIFGGFLIFKALLELGDVSRAKESTQRALDLSNDESYRAKCKARLAKCEFYEQVLSSIDKLPGTSVAPEMWWGHCFEYVPVGHDTPIDMVTTKPCEQCRSEPTEELEIDFKQQLDYDCLLAASSDPRHTIETVSRMVERVCIENLARSNSKDASIVPSAKVSRTMKQYLNGQIKERKAQAGDASDLGGDAVVNLHIAINDIVPEIIARQVMILVLFSKSHSHMSFVAVL